MVVDAFAAEAVDADARAASGPYGPIRPLTPKPRVGGASGAVGDGAVTVIVGG